MSAWWLLLAAVGSAVLAGLAVAVSIRVAHRVGMHDHPDGDRKIQERPIPKLGGVAVAAAFAVAVVVIVVLFRGTGDAALATSVMVPALLAALVGYFDDRRDLNPWLRLALQAAVAVLAWALGTQISLFGNSWLDAALFVLWFMVVLNGINLLDNSDGLAGATVLVASLGATAVAVFNGQELVSLLAIALAGVAAGFLWHNWYPATVYLGDAGSYFLGSLLAIVLVRLRPAEAPVLAGLVIALLLALLPIVDTIYVVQKRVRAGIHPFTAGRDHMSHVLQERGHSVPRAVLLLMGLLVISSGAAVGLAAFYAAG